MENHKRTHKKLVVIRPQNFQPSQFSSVPEQKFKLISTLPSQPPINLKKRKNETILSSSQISKKTKIQVVHPVLNQNSSNDLLKQAMEISDLNAIMNGVTPEADEIHKPESKMSNLLTKAMEISDLNSIISSCPEEEQPNLLTNPDAELTNCVQVNYGNDNKAVNDFNIDFLLQ